LNQSLDGYVDHQKFAPGPLLFRHFVEHVRALTEACRFRNEPTAS
jgi:hypothetical protein